MSEQNRKLIVRWFEEVWNHGRREVIDELLSPDCIIQDGVTSIRGPEEFKQYFDRMHESFSDIRVTPQHAFSDGDYVCLRWSVKMRHTGLGMGMPPTGKNIEATGISIVRFIGGRFAKAWQNWDMLGAMQQITEQGAAPVYMAPP